MHGVIEYIYKDKEVFIFIDPFPKEIEYPMDINIETCPMALTYVNGKSVRRRTRLKNEIFCALAIVVFNIFIAADNRIDSVDDVDKDVYCLNRHGVTL